MKRLSVLTAVLLCAGLASGCSSGTTMSSESASASPTTSLLADPTAEVMELVDRAMAEDDLASVIVRVELDGAPILTEARGESMTGVPATPQMHFRNGAVAIPLVANLVLQLVDDGTVALDDPVSQWLPDLPHSRRVTLRDLVQMTSGYPDYVRSEKFIDAFYNDPFRQWEPEELLDFVKDEPLDYQPGTNWSYAHTNYVILGLALEEITGEPLERAMQERVLEPLGLLNTSGNGNTPQIPEPALHAFTAERKEHLGIPAKRRFFEESTYWNPSWTLARGAVQTTDIADLARTAEAVGTGDLLSTQSYEAMVSPSLRGFGEPVPGCDTCLRQTDGYTFGLGVVISGDWLTQNPMFAGASGAFGYLPERKVAVAVATTYRESAFDDPNGPPNRAAELMREIATLIVPENPPPSPPRRG